MKMDKGGASWRGWVFAPFGNAKEWRLTAPMGNNTTYDFTAEEIRDLYGARREAEFLAREVRELREKASENTFYFSDDDIKVLHAALAILLRVLPTQRWMAVHRGFRIKAA